MPLPRAHLQDEVVGIGASYEARAEVLDRLVQRRVGPLHRPPEIAPPPLLRVEPAAPDRRERRKPFDRRRGVVAAVEGRVRGERGYLSFEPHDTMRVGLRRARRGHDAIREIGIADGPLERLLGAHREADDRAKVRDVQLVHQQPMDRFDVVADRHHRKPRTVERLGRVARRRRLAVAEELRRDEEVRRSLEEPGRQRYIALWERLG